MCNDFSMLVATTASLPVGEYPSQVNLEYYYWYTCNHPFVLPLDIEYQETKPSGTTNTLMHNVPEWSDTL